MSVFEVKFSTRMLGRTKITPLWLIILLANTTGFVISPPGVATLAVRRSIAVANTSRQSVLEINTATSNTRLFYEKGGGGGSIDGTDVGIYIQIFVLMVCIWLFTMPPNFRRAHICAPQDDDGCVSFQQWTEGVADYYKGGGGIEWDFSIDPKTLAENEQMKEAIFGNRK